MKNMTGIFGVVTMLFATQSLANETIRAAVSVHTLRCEIQAGQGSVANRTSTLLAGSIMEPRLMIIGDEEGAIQLEHRIGHLAGCEIEKLDQIFQESIQNFGYRINTPITVTKTTGKAFQGPDGQCVALYTEKLQIDLGLGIVLETHEAEARPSQACLRLHPAWPSFRNFFFDEFLLQWRQCFALIDKNKSVVTI